MNRRWLLCACLIAAFVQIGFAQKDYRAEFNVLFEKEDYAGQAKLLEAWEKAKPDDPELYVAYFNHFINKGRQEFLTMSADRPPGDSLKMTKADDPKTVFYLGSQVSFRREEFDRALVYIDRGIAKFPNRLDMRFGKTYALGQIEDYRRFTDEIVKTLEYSGVNRNAWLWMEDKPVENPKKFMLSSIQDYVAQLFDAEGDYGAFIRTIAETVLKFYPDSVENLSNLGVSYMIQNDFDRALPPLLKAEKLAPTDYIVLANIAFCYFKRGINRTPSSITKRSSNTGTTTPGRRRGRN
ncbi:MAG: tetratricopeptide repeat protein [Acidobacteria bacterium]|nr:tetratricopeptide repeat protein [Acidobacteriota bacterium]